ncbi:class I SAM-dependent methyltransferase [Thalassotalea sp. HSM 43]|uniref:class I SAM-dependent methyltransferase n=1 Tax=Thalassotalea sp. HSM 43 TaxID=2552945 RepID=UPI001080A87C|nr:class I SAM-dependent methyltransferase [Thalassotalea sp. HSM 43]QBY03453.1 class I SAM-dependent methyltransferase [Thalassotalea sp. HSM 43]
MMSKLPENNNLVSFDKDYGLYFNDLSWVPAPRYVLRRFRVCKILRGISTARILEVGCGAGALSYDCWQKGYEVEVLERSAEARLVASQTLLNTAVAKSIHAESLDWNQQFDVIMSFEVLEHIENDKAALIEWLKWLKPGGMCLLSVPALMSKWGPKDVWAGHFRRYEKQEFLKLMNDCGLECIHFETYGYPLTYLTNILRDRIHNADSKKRPVGDLEGTERSGIERKSEAKLFSFQQSYIGRMLMRLCCHAQSAFAKFGLGDGYIVLAKKKN